MIVLQILYIISTVGLAVLGVNALFLSIVYLKYRNCTMEPPEIGDDEWPTVVIQLPIYNERHVVERLVSAACQIDYPKDRLSIQLLDDSTDNTTTIAEVAVEHARKCGTQIDHIRRPDRIGYKAGALAHGLQQSKAEFSAVFDADFVPKPDFLQQIIPYFYLGARVGMVQARWAHLNDAYSPLTRAQALAIDNHFVVEQTAQYRGKLMMNFTGTGGVWRCACIADSGGWQADTLSEDLDLSYRAQLAGWHFVYLPDVAVPAEIPMLMAGFKRQQSRWATGTVQCLRKLGSTVLRSQMTIVQKLQAILRMSVYFSSPLMLVLLLTLLPLMLNNRLDKVTLSGIGLAMFGLPLQSFLAQRFLYHDWRKRLVYFPLFMLLGPGIAVSNTVAVLKGFSKHPQAFLRTPKFQVDTTGKNWLDSAYLIPVGRITWLELILAIYSSVLAVIAYKYEPAFVPFMMLYSLGFSWVAGTNLLQAHLSQRSCRHRHPGWSFIKNR